jgi:hypothetical protein
MECFKCHKIFKLKTDLQSHLNRKIKCDRILQCEKCKKEFTTKQNLNSHLNNKKPCDNISLEAENTILKLQKELLETKLEKENLKSKSQNNIIDTNNIKYKKQEQNIKNDLKDDIEYIYLLQERTSVESEIDVYKIGKSTQKNYKRFDSYHKGFKLLLHIKCDNCDLIEKQIINSFKIKYNHYEKFGNEYFEGDYKEMMIDIINLVL